MSILTIKHISQEERKPFNYPIFGEKKISRHGQDFFGLDFANMYNQDLSEPKTDVSEYDSYEDGDEPIGDDDNSDDVIVKKAQSQNEAPELFTAEQLEQIRRAAYDEGYQQGKADAEEKIDNDNLQQEKEYHERMQEMLGNVSRQLAAIATIPEQNIITTQKMIGDMSLAVGKKLAGDALESNPTAETLQIIRQALAIAYAEPELTIAVHPDFEELMNSKISEVATEVNFKGNINIIGDDQLNSQYDCKVRWSNGKIERDYQQIFDEMQGIINSEAI